MKRYLGGLLLLLMTSWGSIAVAQQNYEVDNVIINGGFEDGFQADFGIGYGWGGFSNGDAVVGWNADSWPEVVVAGQYSQLMQIEKATAEDRIAGIYQTVAVVPGEQYKLTIKGLIRSQEGEVEASDYGYGLQYAIDDEGSTAWEALPDEAWQDIAWNEQPLYEAGSDRNYKFETHQTTITAENEQLTLFIRGWKKWVNEGAVVFNLDEVSLRGPVPGSAEEQMAVASVESTEERPTPPAEKMTAATPEEDASLQVSHQTEQSSADEETALAEVAEDIEPVTDSESATTETVGDDSESEEVAAPVTDDSTEAATDATTPAEVDADSEVEPVEAIPAAPEIESPAESSVVEQPTEVASPAQLPTTGYGQDYPVIYLFGVGAGLLMILFTGAMLALGQRGR